MRISTRGKNAIKLMLDLAEHDQTEPIKLKDIAKRQNISEKYLEQIIAELHKAELVKSTRGAHGGYLLRFPPEQYTVGQILRTVEGNLSSTDCSDKNGFPCENRAACASFLLWEKLDTAMNSVLEGITLADMLEWQNGLVIDQYVI